MTGSEPATDRHVLHGHGMASRSSLQRCINCGLQEAVPSPLLFSLSVSTWATVLQPLYTGHLVNHVPVLLPVPAPIPAPVPYPVYYPQAPAVSHMVTQLFLSRVPLPPCIDARLTHTKFEPDLNFNRVPTSLSNQCLV